MFVLMIHTHLRCSCCYAYTVTHYLTALMVVRISYPHYVCPIILTSSFSCPGHHYYLLDDIIYFISLTLIAKFWFSMRLSNIKGTSIQDYLFSISLFKAFHGCIPLMKGCYFCNLLRAVMTAEQSFSCTSSVYEGYLCCVLECCCCLCCVLKWVFLSFVIHQG